MCTYMYICVLVYICMYVCMCMYGELAKLFVVRLGENNCMY